MALGDVLKSKFDLISNASIERNAPNAFWKVIRDIAREEILACDQPIDSDVFVGCYYFIMKSNEEKIPAYFRKIIPSSKQERYRNVTRNVLTSNAFHPDGLAMQPGIKTKRSINFSRKGNRIIYFK